MQIQLTESLKSVFIETCKRQEEQKMNRIAFFLSLFLSLLLALGLLESASPLLKQAIAQEHELGENYSTTSNHLHLAQEQHQPKQPKIELFNNLGNHHHPISTSNLIAQRYFDQGLILMYGFDHAEAIRSFQEAIKLDSQCAMCYWGIAVALGPNINAPMQDAAVPEAYQTLQKALVLAPKVSKVEQAYIQALAKRYVAKPIPNRTLLDQAYAMAMRELSRRYPDDPDAATLFAEALMDLSPWNFWTKDKQPTTYTQEIVATLESILQQNPSHPGANHFYIHAVEASNTPERAIPSAQRLETLVPGAGHLLHMPGHVYWRVGRYNDVVRVNQSAIQVDEVNLNSAFQDHEAHKYYALAYYPHNIDFLFAATHMAGRSELALAAARKIVAIIPEEAYGQFPPLETYKPTPLFALVRFGKWQQILQEQKPDPQRQYTTGMWHWARGMSYRRLGQLDEAAKEYEQLLKIAQTDAMKELTLGFFPKASTLLEIASHVLAGELAGAYEHRNEMIAHLQQAVQIQDSLRYAEPPSWYYPVRQNLGAALLQAGQAQAAEAVYQEDIKQNRNNGWSLFGLTQSLQAQGKTQEAQAVQSRFEQAWQYADVILTSSQF